ncbi:hypothetical protein ABZV93_17015 [Actinopolymorpha sp. NPDC004070]|uniref:hypothetical protein n=1 Tax=Actinopolymorpha sp. NPDC004070 TaxID=3154548 RepID=UPI0033B5AFFA
MAADAAARAVVPLDPVPPVPVLLLVVVFAVVSVVVPTALNVALILLFDTPVIVSLVAAVVG